MKVKEFTVTLSVLEIKAMMVALGGMTGTDYDDQDLHNAGSDVYSWCVGINDLFEEE